MLMPWPEKILNAFFQSVTSRTAGFNTFSTGAMATYTLFFIMMLMFIGGASGSTAGGIKVNTAGLIIATIWNTIKGREYPGAFGREFTVSADISGHDASGIIFAGNSCRSTDTFSHREVPFYQYSL